MRKTIIDTLKKYKFVALILLVGLVLMLLPSGEKEQPMENDRGTESFSLAETERRRA